MSNENMNYDNEINLESDILIGIMVYKHQEDINRDILIEIMTYSKTSVESEEEEFLAPPRKTKIPTDDSEEDEDEDEDNNTNTSRRPIHSKSKEFGKLLSNREQKELLNKKIKEKYHFNNTCGPFSVKIYDFNDELQIRNALLQSIERLNDNSTMLFALDDDRTKFHLTDEYIISTFYVIYQPLEMKMNDTEVQSDDSSYIAPAKREREKIIIDNLFDKLFEGCENKQSKIQKLETIIYNNFVNEVVSIEKDLPDREKKWIKDRLKKEANNRLLIFEHNIY
jgi:hypothetical protein